MIISTFLDKKIVFSLSILVVGFVADPVLAGCPSSGLAASSGATDINGNCAVVGDINLSGSATLTMSNGNLSVTGKIILQENSVLSVTTGTLTFPQTNFAQHSIKLNGQSQFTMTDSTFVTNATIQNSFAMSINANDNSVVRFENSNLNIKTGSWLIGNFNNNSKLTVINSQYLPTEIYPHDASTISVSSSSFSTTWLNFASGDMGTVNIPKLDNQGKFNLIFTPSHGNIYSVNISSSNCRIGLNSHPNSTLTVNGNAAVNYANVVFGYYVENNTGPVVIDGLITGGVVTKQFRDQGRNLTLNNVYLNPVTWQVYVTQTNGYPVYIKNSVINEIAAFTNGILNISESTLQYAVSGAVGPGSKLNINNTHIWSSSILAIGGQVNISNSYVHGNNITATGVVGASSKINLINVIESRNGISPQSCASVGGYPPNNNGVPLCNPFNPLYQCSKVTATGGATINANPKLTCSLSVWRVIR